MKKMNDKRMTSHRNTTEKINPGVDLDDPVVWAKFLSELRYLGEILREAKAEEKSDVNNEI